MTATDQCPMRSRLAGQDATTMSGPSSSHNQSIRAIDASSIHHITSGQVAVDLQTVIKELVENALDAGATNIGMRVLGCHPLQS